MSYAELQVTSQFSFLRGASSPRELFEQAALLGLPALSIVDRNSVAGLVRAHEAARETNVRLVVGCRLDLQEASVLVYPTDKAAYGRLCRLLTIGKGRAGKAGCHLAWNDLAEWAEGLVAVLLTDRADANLAADLTRLKSIFGGRAYCALTRQFRPNDHLRLGAIEDLARAARVPTVATGDVLYHRPERRMLQDVVAAIRLKTTVDRLGSRRERHAHRHLKPSQEMARLFLRHPDAVGRTLDIVDRCRFSLDELEYVYPTEAVEDGRTAQERLDALTWTGAAGRYPGGVPDKVALQLRYELDLIGKLGYAPYFLTVDSIVRFARSRNILCQGRGSAANSAVCFVLGITSIDPAALSDLLFERFISEERNEPPDIDVDFEHDRREEVLQWVYETYGRHRAALTAAVSTYHAKGAIRDVGKALGVPDDITAALSGLTWGWSAEGFTERDLKELNLNPDDRRLKLAMEFARELIGAPRHLSQHPGGFVLTLGRLDELVPIEPAAMKDRQVIEWDKNDIDTMGMMKVDCLGLGMLGVLRRCFDLLKRHKDVALDLATVPPDDGPTYAMIQAGDTIGVFQIESRAQMAMLPRLRPMSFRDLIVEVAVVRPGPIQGDMVHPYLRRREKREPPVILRPELEPVLGWTLGIPLFQEQAMMVAVTGAGFTKSEADQLRRAMATFKSTAGVSKFKEKLISGMIENDYEPEFAHRMFRQLEGFGSYGFPFSHAASFARLAYASSYLKCHHPDAFCCALLNSQPMGFYAAAQLVYDARKHGVEVRPPDVNHSGWDNTLEPTGGPYLAVRLGFRLASGLAEKDAARIIAERGSGPFASIEDLWRRAEVGTGALERLANADGFESLGLSRREALWIIKGLGDRPLPLFAAADKRDGAIRPEVSEAPVALPRMARGREVVEDYRAKGLTLRDHPVAFVRGDLAAKRIIGCADLKSVPHGRTVTVAGLVLLRQRPGSAKGVMFITLEDETEEVANLIIRPELFERQRRVILSSGLMACRGRVQRQSDVTHVLAEHLTDRTDLLHAIGGRDEVFIMAAGRGEGAALSPKVRDIDIPDLQIQGSRETPGRPIQGGPAIQVKARNFH